MKSDLAGNQKINLFKIAHGTTAIIIDERTGKRYPVQVVPKGLRLGRPIVVKA